MLSKCAVGFYRLISNTHIGTKQMKIFTKIIRRSFVMKSILPALAVLVSFGAVNMTSITEAAAASSYQQGKIAGKKAGYKHGYQDGFKYGYKRGYRDELRRPNNGYSTQRNANAFNWAEYVRGYKAGYRIGYENGYPVGKSEGRREGRNEAKDFKDELRDLMRQRCRYGYCD